MAKQRLESAVVRSNSNAYAPLPFAPNDAWGDKDRQGEGKSRRLPDPRIAANRGVRRCPSPRPGLARQLDSRRKGVARKPEMPAPGAGHVAADDVPLLIRVGVAITILWAVTWLVGPLGWLGNGVRSDNLT